MLHLHIPFSGSWTNSFADENFQPRFTSGASFSAGMRGLTAPPLVDAPENTSRVENIRALMAANTVEEDGRQVCKMTYQVPVSYDNTVRGVLARLLGMVERLSALPEDHPIHGLFDRMSYELHIDHEHDELVSLATPPNELQGSGAGLMPTGNPFYEGGDLAKSLFGYLGDTTEAIVAGTAQSDWTPSSPSQLIAKLQQHKDVQAEIIAANKGNDVSPFKAQADAIAASFVKAGLDIPLNPDVDRWHWAGAVLVAKIHLLPEDQKQALIASGALSARGNFAGVAMTQAIGNITIKDVYAGAGCQKAYSTRIPFSVETWFENPTNPAKKTKFALGVIKKSGLLHIKLALGEEEARQVMQILDDAAVGPLHFGKKGIAFLQRKYIS